MGRAAVSVGCFAGLKRCVRMRILRPAFETWVGTTAWNEHEYSMEIRNDDRS
jgi:hypothetical protein